MAGSLATIFVEVRAQTVNLKRDVEKGAAEAGSVAGKAFNTAFVASGVLAVGVGVVLGSAIKAAGDFQAAMTRLKTSANETGTATSGNLKLVSGQILALAGPLGTSVKALSTAMYTVESGGFHGAAGILVLKAAAQGAKAENANLTTVTDALTSAMTDYHVPASQAAEVTSKLVATTASGKLTFEQLAGSLHSVLPAAANAHISLNDILGDLASMTVHGESADQATQNLTDVIRHMQQPTQVQANELALLGLTTQQLATDLRDKGLSGTLQEISKRILNLSPPGTIEVVTQTKNALASLSPPVRKLGEELLSGAISYKGYRTEAGALDPVQRAQAMQFATLVSSTHRVGDAQISARQVMQSYGGALQKATGDATGMNVALMLTGENAGLTNQAIKNVAGATTEAGNNVRGWSEIQGTFNFKLASFKATAEATGIQLGTVLLPAAGKLVTTIQGIITPLGNWIVKHQQLTSQIALGAAALSGFILSVLAVAKIVSMVTRVIELLRIVAIVQGLWTAAMYAFSIITDGAALKVALYLAWCNIAKVGTMIWTAVQWLLNAAFLGFPLVWILAAFALIVAAVVLAIKYHKQIADFIVSVWNKVWKESANIIRDVVAFFVDRWNWLRTTTLSIFAAIRNFIVGVWDAIAGPIHAFLLPTIQALQVGWSIAWATIKLAAQVGWAIIQIIFALIRITVSGLIDIWRLFESAWRVAWSAISSVAVAFWHILLQLVWDPFIAKVHSVEAFVGAFVAGVRAKWDTMVSWLRSGWALLVAVLWDPFVAKLASVRQFFGAFASAVGAVWDSFAAKLRNVWNGIVSGVFNPIANFITNTLPNAFSKGVGAIGRFWDGLREIVAKPVRFMIDTVIDKGILGGLRWVVSKLGISNVHIDDYHPAGLAEGGPISGPGTGTSDSIPAMVRETGRMLMVSNGEFVIPAKKVAEVGVSNLNRWIGHPDTMYPGDGASGIRFAGGGVIGELSSLASGLFGLFTNPSKLFATAAKHVLDLIPAGGDVKKVLVGTGLKAVGWAENWLAAKVKALVSIFSSSGGSVTGAFAPGAVGNVAGAQAFLLGANGRPYGWNMAGPGSYDCSGIVSAVWNILHGRSPYNHTFSTMNEAPFFPLRGMGGILSAAWTNPGENGVGGGPNGVGHTMGILNGMPFESTGSRGVHLSNVTSPGRFAHQGHLAAGGLIPYASFDGGGRWPTNTLGFNSSGRDEHVVNGATLDTLIEEIRGLRADVRRVAPGVGNEINRTGRGLMTIARAH